MKLDYSRHYRKWHSDDPEHVVAVKAYYQRILGPHMPENRQACVLDVGCGMGFALLALQDLGYEQIEGIDVDQSQIDACRKNGLEAVRVESSQQWMRDRPGRFDCVLLFDVIEHISVSQQMDFVQAVAGSLKETGILLCTVPNANSLLAGRYRYIDWTHQCSFTEHSLDFLLYHGGFEDVQVMEVETQLPPRRVWWPGGGGLHWWAFCFFRWWRRLQMMAELGPAQGRTVPLSLNLLAKATKR